MLTELCSVQNIVALLFRGSLGCAHSESPKSPESFRDYFFAECLFFLAALMQYAFLMNAFLLNAYFP